MGVKMIGKRKLAHFNNSPVAHSTNCEHYYGPLFLFCTLCSWIKPARERTFLSFFFFLAIINAFFFYHMGNGQERKRKWTLAWTFEWLNIFFFWHFTEMLANKQFVHIDLILMMVLVITTTPCARGGYTENGFLGQAIAYKKISSKTEYDTWLCQLNLAYCSMTLI